MAKLLQVAYDINGKVVSIYDVATGRACNCTCPECGEGLDAKNKNKKEDTQLGPNQKVAHFAHSSGRVCSYATESAIHFMAKKILAENKRLTLPYYEFINGRLQTKEKYCEFDSIELEKNYESENFLVRPDAIGVIKEKKLFIEFKKTHAVDLEKAEKLRKIGISTIEIDLTDIDPLRHGKPNFKELSEFLEYSSDYRSWVYNPREQKVLEVKKQFDEYKRKEAQEQAAREEAEIREEERKQFEARKKKLIADEKWKEETLAKGYRMLKVYRFGNWDYGTEESVYCPKLQREDNRLPIDQCISCEFHYEKKYLEGEKKIFCGYRSNLKAW